MPNLAPTRNRFRSAAIALAVVCVVAVAYLFAPIGSAKAEKYAELNQLRDEWKARSQEIIPLRGLPNKVNVSAKDIDTFYRTRLPSRFSLMSSELGRLASKNNVQLSQVGYESFDDEHNLTNVVMKADLSGNYSDVVKFINSVERDEMFFIIDEINLADEKAGKVKLNLTLETYIHPEGIKASPKKSDKEAAD